MKKMKKLFSCLLLVVTTLLIPVTAYAEEASRAELLKQAGFNTVLGICTVFVMLVIISLIIYCFKFIPMIQKAFSKKSDAVEEVKKPVQTVSATVQDTEDEFELVAVIAAAIAASEQVPIDSFVVRTIKRRA